MALPAELAGATQEMLVSLMYVAGATMLPN